MADKKQKKLTVADPCPSYNHQKDLWVKCRAFCSGEEAVKAHDSLVELTGNFLIPFSGKMSQDQYNFLRREAELPGVSSEFAQLLVGALLRKEPIVQLPEGYEDELNWIMNEITTDGSPLVTYLDAMLYDEIVTARSWHYIEYIDDAPVICLWPAESVINWKQDKGVLTQVIVLEAESVGGDEFHPEYDTVVYVHELVDSKYQVRKFTYNDSAKDWQADEYIDIPLKNGEPLDSIPAWPCNGQIEPVTPFLNTIVNKEAALYNKIARRNHLLFGAATYTPYTVGLEDEQFNKVVNSGLGAWLNLPADSKIGVLETPTDALDDLEKAIASGFEELARLGIRMMSPENNQSGVALQLRNASQTAKIGTLNTRISVIMCQVIAELVNWKYSDREPITPEDVKFQLQSDFSTYLGGEGWLRLATEWYENNLIPRDIWIQILKQQEVLPDDYQGEIDREEDDRFGRYLDDKDKEED